MPPTLLVDTMIVIEAVRTGCWNAITGQRQVVTVEECAEELRRGDPGTREYVRVTNQDIARITIAPLAAEDAPALRLAYPAADGLDAGERDLLAHAMTRTDEFQVCSCDKAALVAAHALAWLDRVVSLEAVATSVGARPNPRLKVQFTEARMVQWRTSLKMGGPI
jgi:hypothetical protein